MFEMMVSIMILTSFSLIALTKFNNNTYAYLSFIEECFSKQADSLINKQKNYVDNPYSKYDVYYNKSGSVNMAQTIVVDGKEIIIHLGNGYITHE